MLGFEYFRQRREGFTPRTPAAALRAMGLGVLPEESFVYLSTSQKPLDEEPFDLEEIERVLARKDLDLETNILLKEILEKLVSAGEQETSLFGAEGINLLEARYIDRIEELRRAMKEETGKSSDAVAHLMRATARCYFELALLHGKTRSIKTFYLKEAYTHFRDSLRASSKMAHGELDLLVKVLVELGMYDHAARILSGVREPQGRKPGAASCAPDPEILLLRAEVAFHRRDFSEVVRTCRQLSQCAALTPGQQRLIAYWLGAA